MREDLAIKADRESYLEAVLATLPECVAIVDRNLRLIDINRAGLEKIGVACFEDLPAGVPLNLFPERHQKIYRGAFQAVLEGKTDQTGQPFRIELDALDGQVHLMECRLAPLTDSKGDIDAVVITSRDVSDWQAALETSERASSIMQSILATVPDALVVVDEQGLITSFSVTAQKLFGYSEQEMLGQNVNILMPQPHHDAHDGYMKRYMRTGEPKIIGIGRDVEARKKDGSIFPIRLELGEARVGDSRLFTGFIVDQTERKQTEAELQALQAELLHASRLNAVGTLASALAHEINQPLTAISNYLSAARDLLDEDAHKNKEQLLEALRESISESLRAGTIVRRLREFVSKGETNRQNLSIAQLVEDATTLGLVGAHDKGVECTVEIAADTNHVFVDRVQMQQVMINLMRNAIEAMSDSPVKRLAIAVQSTADDQVEITVSDTGSGIAADMVDKIFNPFASTKGDGMGLGLSICRTIMEAHDGKIRAEPNPQGGTVFRIILPKSEVE